jgi:hypothetical protein
LFIPHFKGTKIKRLTLNDQTALKCWDSPYAIAWALMTICGKTKPHIFRDYSTGHEKVREMNPSLETEIFLCPLKIFIQHPPRIFIDRRMTTLSNRKFTDKNPNKQTIQIIENELDAPVTVAAGVVDHRTIKEVVKISSMIEQNCEDWRHSGTDA